MQPPHSTGWRRLIGCLKLQVIFCKRATNYRALSRKMTYEEQGSCHSTPPCVDTCGVDIWEGLDVVMYGLETCRHMGKPRSGHVWTRNMQNRRMWRRHQQIGCNNGISGFHENFPPPPPLLQLSVDVQLLNRHVGGLGSRYVHCNTLQHTAAHCNTLQHTATHCSTLQHTAIHEGAQIQECALQHTAATTTNCNTLQHTATHCNA